MTKKLTYQQKLNRNVITRFLHSRRYKSLHQFVAKKYDSQPVRILDIGCGPGGAFAQLNEPFNIDYTGIDIRKDFIAAAKERHADGKFSVADVTEPDFDLSGYDLIIALETFEHIPEGKLVRVIERIAEARPDYLICSVPIEIGPSVAIKNFGARAMGYNRSSGNIKQTFHAATYNLNRLPAHDIAHLGFNWIWLEQTLRHSFDILTSDALPHKLIPKAFAPSVIFTCRPRNTTR